MKPQNGTFFPHRQHLGPYAQSSQDCIKKSQAKKWGDLQEGTEYFISNDHELSQLDPSLINISSENFRDYFPGQLDHSYTNQNVLCVSFVQTLDSIVSLFLRRLGFAAIQKSTILQKKKAIYLGTLISFIEFKQKINLNYAFYLLCRINTKFRVNGTLEIFEQKDQAFYGATTCVETSESTIKTPHLLNSDSNHFQDKPLNQILIPEQIIRDKISNEKAMKKPRKTIVRKKLSGAVVSFNPNIQHKKHNHKKGSQRARTTGNFQLTQSQRDMGFSDSKLNNVGNKNKTSVDFQHETANDINRDKCEAQDYPQAIFICKGKIQMPLKLKSSSLRDNRSPRCSSEPQPPDEDMLPFQKVCTPDTKLRSTLPSPILKHLLTPYTQPQQHSKSILKTQHVSQEELKLKVKISKSEDNLNIKCADNYNSFIKKNNQNFQTNQKIRHDGHTNAYQQQFREVEKHIINKPNFHNRQKIVPMFRESTHRTASITQNNKRPFYKFQFTHSQKKKQKELQTNYTGKVQHTFSSHGTTDQPKHIPMTGYKFSARTYKKPQFESQSKINLHLPKNLKLESQGHSQINLGVKYE